MDFSGVLGSHDLECSSSTLRLRGRKVKGSQDGNDDQSRRTGVQTCLVGGRIGSGGGIRLGNNSTTDSRTPVQVASLSGVAAIAAGRQHALALKNDGTVWAWGSNGDGQLSDGSTANFTS